MAKKIPLLQRTLEVLSVWNAVPGVW